MIDAKTFLGLPVNFKNKLLIYPAKVMDIIGIDQFPIYRKLITISQEELEDEYTKDGKDVKDVPTPFIYLMTNIAANDDFLAMAKKAFFFFLHEDVNFLLDDKLILIGNLEKSLSEAKSINDLRFLREEDYFDFQNMIRVSLGDKPLEPPNPNEDPRIKRIKAKARYRDMIKAKSGLGITLETSLASICCMGLGITPLNIGEMSYASMNLIMQTYQEKEKYEIDMDSLLAGADSKKVKPKYWIRNLKD